MLAGKQLQIPAACVRGRPKYARTSRLFIERQRVSGILLDESYYEFLKSMVREAGGISVLDEAAIIPFKARAWLDPTRQRAEGNQVDEKNIRKHRNDVARLVQLLSQEARYELPRPVADDVLAFVESSAIEDDFDPRQFEVNMTREDVATRLRAAYQL